ncbi:flagellar motor protein MotB [Nocardioides sp. InS609-2]|uniref:OmpA/MotB family protein n=1 Tax=Nocardioides sp. InS609-2 TaxID=2760705 RepID=UPI0020BFFB64|nr:flagellar motor protein MotB [Nocardioides sp. InS609-2]
MAGRKGKRVPEEEHENHERWLVTYADMVTLLMVLFIVMFAMSSVDQRKFHELKSGLSAGFGQPSAMLDGGTSLLEEPGSAVADSIVPQAQTAEMAPETRDEVSLAVADNARLEQQRKVAEAKSEVNRLKEVLERLYKALRAHGLEDDVKATIDDRGLVVSLVSRHVVFAPNVADLTARGQLVIDTLAPVLKDLPDKLQIDGHTNQVKVKPALYPTDWELSAARAVTVLRRLGEKWRIPGARMTASAFGHERPLIDPSKPGSQAVNKRVDIVILTALPAETRELISEVVDSDTAPAAQGASS